MVRPISNLRMPEGPEIECFQNQTDYFPSFLIWRLMEGRCYRGEEAISGGTRKHCNLVWRWGWHNKQKGWNVCRQSSITEFMRSENTCEWVVCPFTWVGKVLEQSQLKPILTRERHKLNSRTLEGISPLLWTERFAYFMPLAQTKNNRNINYYGITGWGIWVESRWA